MLVGLIWVIQVVAYPQFLRVRKDGFADYHLAHCWRIGLLIGPLLFVEAVTALWLLLHGQRGVAFQISLGLIVGNWLSTAIFQAPAHMKLMSGFDVAVIRRLIFTNWLRTLAWTTRGILLALMVIR